MHKGFPVKSRAMKARSAMLLAGAALGAGIAPHAAFAADAVEQAAEGSAPSSAEIIVTANRREERAQDVPISKIGRAHV